MSEKTQNKYTHLITLWIPLVNVQEDKIISKQNYHITINKLGFIYIQHEQRELEKIFIDELYTNLYKNLTGETKKLIKDTLLNKSLKEEKEEKEEKIDFIALFKELDTKYTSPSDKNPSINIEHIEYTLKNHDTVYLNKFNLSDMELDKIINRNFEKLLQKSILYTDELTFDQEETYDLGYINKITFLDEALKIKINDKSIEEDNKKVLDGILYKAIQDSIEEVAIYKFLKETQNHHLRTILAKLEDVNQSLLYLNSTILHIDNPETSNSSNNLMSEEEIEVFSHRLMHITPLFRVIESKAKEAYYIKIGNITTESNITNDEIIEKTLVYVNWKMAIDYFENISEKIQRTLSVYHQNRNIKELEHISYYESYKADLADIRNISQSNPNKALQSKNKKDLSYLAFFVSLAILGENAEFITKDSFIHFFNNWEITKNLILYMKEHSQTFIPFLSEIIPLTARILVLFIFGIFLYSIILEPLYSIILKPLNSFILKPLYSKITKQYFLLKEKIELSIKNKKTNQYFEFENDDYDKHEHQSKQPIYADIKDKGILTLSYVDTKSAYNLITELKKSKVNDTYNLFPDLLKNIDESIQNKGYTYRENYRLLRNDKTITKILFRYRINELKLHDFINFIEEDSYYLNQQNEAKNVINLSEQEIVKELKTHKNIKLDFYIVYSFNLKKSIEDMTEEEHMSKGSLNTYYYEVFKNQFRVHYHLNKLPIKDLDKYQGCIAELIHMYFFKRLKTYHKIEESTNNDKK